MNVSQKREIDQLIAQQRYKTEAGKQSSLQSRQELSQSHTKPGNHLSKALSGDFSSVDQLKSHRDQIAGHLETLDYSKVIVPTNIGVKFRPPKIGIEFYLKNDEGFNRSLHRKDSYDALIINDIDCFSQKLLVHEINLDRFFFTKEAQFHGEKSYDINRENAHLSPMKEKLSASQICRRLYEDRQHSAFLNPRIIKQSQIDRLLKMMIDRYQNFFRERSASRERGSRDNKENTNSSLNASQKSQVPKPPSTVTPDIPVALVNQLDSQRSGVS
jgi:hypothetical protein